jgi:hypothetical protein
MTLLIFLLMLPINSAQQLIPLITRKTVGLFSSRQSGTGIERFVVF